VDTIKGILAILAALLDKMCGDDSWLKSGAQDMLAKLESECQTLRDEREDYREKMFAEMDRNSELRDELGSTRTRLDSANSRIDELESRVYGQGPTFQIMLLGKVTSGNLISCVKALRKGRTAMKHTNCGLRECKERVEEVRDEASPVLIYEGKDMAEVKTLCEILNCNFSGYPRYSEDLPAYTVKIL
jgi:polyhydroxyalkanoate synthesis regulator phasin